MSPSFRVETTELVIIFIIYLTRVEVQIFGP